MPNRITSHPYLNLPDLGQPVVFYFNGKPISAYETDTISSALVAAGVKILSRSFKFHRPRGLYDGHGQGPESLFTVDGEPNVLGDRTLVRAGMQVQTQNAWPSVERDLTAINNWLVPRLPNLFYYKLFHKPRWLWPIAEKAIRRVAGLGQLDRSGSSKRYEKRYRFPDVALRG
jgi:sarcosine oxidase, subunit alpha